MCLIPGLFGNAKNTNKKSNELTVNKEGNSLLVPTNKNHKDWYKNIKKLIENPGLVKEISDNLYNTVKDTYSIQAVCADRRKLYISKLGVEKFNDKYVEIVK